MPVTTMMAVTDRLHAPPRIGDDATMISRPASEVRQQDAGDVPAPLSARPDRLGRRTPLSGTRTRILAAFAILTALSAALSLFLIREVLFNRLDEEVEQQLTQEVAEFRRLVRGNDPRSGAPFGTDVRRIFDVYFARNVPDEGEGSIAASTSAITFGWVILGFRRIAGRSPGGIGGLAELPGAAISPGPFPPMGSLLRHPVCALHVDSSFALDLAADLLP